MKRKLIPLVLLCGLGLIVSSCGAEKVTVEGTAQLSDGTIKVHELASQEMKSTAGATWDAATAGDTLETWASKYGTSIDMVLSNNDGMAMNMLGRSAFPNVPIFGYDANADAVASIKTGKLTGTVSQNVDQQAILTLLLLRNAFDGKTGDDIRTYGITTPADELDGGWQISKPVSYVAESKALLLANTAVTAANADEFAEGSHDTGISEVYNEENGGMSLLTHPTKKVLLTIYNSSDNFLSSSYLPAVNYWAPLFNLTVTVVQGDGQSESAITDKLVNLDTYDGYAFNMVKTNNAAAYTSKLTGDNAAKPLVWFNRQPSDPDTGVIDQEAMTFNDKTFYSGFDAAAGGTVQGEMVTEFLKTKTIAQLDRNGDGILGYVLAIGDSAHNDSKARTKGVRTALGTWNDSYAGGTY
jgi:ABC-type sugar transport system substrate-binding protein